MNRIHKAKHRNTKSSAIVLALLLLAGCVLFPGMEARADSLSVRASASTVKIGDTVTISITVPAGVSATVNLTYPGNLFSFQSASETANANGGTVSMTLGGYGGTDTATTGTATFKATAAGSATFSASAPVAGNQEGDQVSIGGGSASVTVRNEASGGSSSGSSGGGSGSSGGGSSSSGSSGSSGGESGGSSSSGSSGGPGQEDDSDEGSKSADNSLSSLTLSAGKLSPAFRYNVVNYTATVDYNVTTVVVSAKVSNANAKIESVKGGENLSVGDNIIRIVVKAENGVTATYTITVTRKAKEEEEEEEKEEEENSPQDGDDKEEPPLEPNDDDPPESPEKSFVVDGRTLYPSQDIPEGVEAQGFELENVMLWGQTFPAFVDSFAGGTMQLVYLVDENGEDGGLYLVFSDNMNEAYSYVCLRAERGFLIILPDGDGNVPKEYDAMPTALDLEGFGRVDAWFRDGEREFALVYAVNQLGERGWYTLDTQSLSYVRYQEPAAPAAEEEPSTEQQKEELPSDGADNKKQQTTSHLMIGVAVIVVLIILIIIILVVVLKRSGNMDDDEFDEPDDEDFWSETDAREEPERDFDREIKEPDFSTVEAGLAAAMEKEMADEIKKIADPAPMQTVSTHKDKDDEDLEFIDF